MKTNDALGFLARHQPMPDDAELQREEARTYERARRHFETVRDPRCIELLLHSFGAGSGFGSYQLVEDSLRNQDPAAVAGALPDAIRSERGSVRSWAVEIAAEYPSREVVQAIKDVWDSLDSSSRQWGADILRRAYSDREDAAFVAAVLAAEDDATVRGHLDGLA